MNLDQSGYVKNGTQETVGILTDYTDPESTKFLTDIVKTYTTVQRVVYGKCGCNYLNLLIQDPCTDNAAWSERGYNAALAFESAFQDRFPYNDQVKYDGSALDTVDLIDFPHVLQFVRSTIGYVVELSHASHSRKCKYFYNR